MTVCTFNAKLIYTYEVYCEILRIVVQLSLKQAPAHLSSHPRLPAIGGIIAPAHDAIQGPGR